MLLSAERIIYDGYAYDNVGIEISNDGRIVAIAPLAQLGKPDEYLEGRVLMPSFVNAHSHAFQRLLRGRTHFTGHDDNSFWGWRDAMYRVAQVLDEESLYTTCRQAFMEMVLQGVTSVGEFHYLHHQPDGTPYEDPNALAHVVVRAALDVGIRISLLHVVYLWDDFDQAPRPEQARFCDRSVDASCDRFDQLVTRLLELRDARIAWGIGAHSLRATKMEDIMSLKLRLSHMPFHIHVAEQAREIEGSLRVYGERPVHVLARKGLLDACSTLVHATHITPSEMDEIAKSGALVCVCPATESDLGDGLGPAADLFNRGVQLCLGTDGQNLASIAQEAGLLEMHQRLRLQRRNVLAQPQGDAVATRLLTMATAEGARSLGIETGMIRHGKWADFVAYDLHDPALLGADGWSLLPSLLFSADSRALRDVMVGGKWVVRDGTHPDAVSAGKDFSALSASLYRPQN